MNTENCSHTWQYGGRDEVSEVAKMTVGCECPYWLVCSGCGSRRLVRCGRPSMRACGPCGLRNKARVHRVASSGLHVGRSGLFITLTAPSWVEHFMPNGDACRCTGGGCPDLASWNASAGKRWNRMVQELRRDIGEVEFFKAAEVQRRGALHFHALVRGQGPLVVSKVYLRRLAGKHGFGHEVDVQPVEPRHWGYVAKYASKAAGDRCDVPWRGKRWVGGHRYEQLTDYVTGEVTTLRIGTSERRQVEAYRATYRTWSCSREWGDTMAYVRAAQGHWAAVLEALPSWDGLDVPRAWAFVVVPPRADDDVPADPVEV